MTRRCAEKDKCIQSIKIERHTHQDFWGVYALFLKYSSVFSVIVVLLFMQVGDSRAHRNSSGSGNYEGNGAISEVMGLALHTGLAPAFLYCTTTLNLLLSTSCIQGPTAYWISACFLVLYNYSIPCTTFIYHLYPGPAFQGPAYWIWPFFLVLYNYSIPWTAYWIRPCFLPLYCSFTTIAPLLVLPLTLQFRAPPTGFKVCFLKELLFSASYTNHYFLPLSQISSTNTTILASWNKV